jgi:hypothetical protein
MYKKKLSKLQTGIKNATRGKAITISEQAKIT